MKYQPEGQAPLPAPKNQYGRHGGVPLRMLLAIAAAATSAILGHQLFGWMPHVPDEASYLFQGKILVSGHLWLNPPKVPDAFHVDHIWITANRWCSLYPPGWPLLLALASLFHVPGLMTPILFGLAIIGVWSLADKLYDQRTAWIASIAFAISPFALMTGAGFMAHMPALCAAVWCMVALQSQKRAGIYAAGFLAAYALMIRPFTAVVLLAPILLWSVASEPRKILPMMIGAVLPICFFLFYNDQLFGSPFRTGYAYDTGWNEQIVSALLILLPLILRDPKWKKDAVLGACCLSLIASHSFISWTDIVDGGPRYAFECTGLICILASRAIFRCFDRVEKEAYVAIPLICLTVFPLFSQLPQQIAYHEQNYHGQNHTFLQKVNECGVGSDALVLIAGDRYAFRSFFFGNKFPPEKGSRVYAIDLPQVETAYPRKQTWRITIQWNPLPGPNAYVDRWRLKEFSCKELR
jgi:hypothetical protein